MNYCLIIALSHGRLYKMAFVSDNELCVNQKLQSSIITLSNGAYQLCILGFSGAILTQRPIALVVLRRCLTPKYSLSFLQTLVYADCAMQSSFVA